ncbi:uncharacterized protein LOC126812063 [Patella vulgata]|uniref:uncharacterized protein LOC126812063 n=1 Tax=Patella vulgata TaxID=6465 RepID=UPI00217F8CB5|nr:uncharacterized protein LOC126812063 [Patella vulgata]
MFLLLLVLPGLLADENLFTNPGFENTDAWICNSCKGSLVSDSHGGSHSYKVEQRKYNWGGISQEVFIQPGHNYYFKAYVKLLNTADGKQYHDIEGMLDIIDTDVQQTRSDFGWGSAVNVDYIHDSKHRNYQNFFYDIFEWGVLENALKWPNLEQTKGIFKPGNALAAIDAMRDQLKDPKITQWLFEHAHRYDNNTELYLNDYNIVNGQYSTVAYQDQAMKFLAANIHVDGIGVQSHLGDAIDISVIKRRLDEIAKVGLPIWITELDINESNDLRKAEKYEEVMRLYFSHPAVKGVMFWGFWDGRHWRPAAALANGHDVTPNAAGKKVRELLKQTWRTDVHHSLAHGHTINMRGFLGSYELKIRHDGKTIHTETFDLGKNGNHLRISLAGSGNSTKVGHIIIG